MKRYCLKLFIFIMIMVGIFSGIFLLSAREPFRSILMTMTNASEYGRDASEEIMPYIEEAGHPSEYTKLIIGDSVCRQLFNPFQKYNRVYCTMGSNQAITMIGQYLLIREFLENHQQATDVNLVLCSLTGSGLDHGVYAYQYLVTPFAEAGLLENITEYTKEDLNYKFGKLYMKPEVIQFIDDSPLAKKLFLNSFNNKNHDDVTMTFQYLGLIIDLCEEKGVKLHLLHGPMRESAFEDMKVQREKDLAACSNEQMREYVEKYYQSMTFYPDDYFKDGIHFGDNYKKEDQLAGYIRAIMEKEESISDFSLE